MCIRDRSGIHGSNILDNVARSVFEPIVEYNCRQIAAGQVPAEIVSKTFFDTLCFSAAAEPCSA